MTYKAVVALVATLRDLADMLPHPGNKYCKPEYPNGPVVHQCYLRAIYDRIDELQEELSKEST